MRHTGFLLAIAAAALVAQNQRVIGVAATVDGPGKQLSLRTEQGEVFAVGLMEGAKILQTAPGAKDLKDAKTIEVSDIAQGDRVIATGLLNPSAKTLEAQRLIVMSQTAIAKKQDRDKAEWMRRGWSGRVASVKNETNGVKLLLPGAGGPAAAPKEVMVQVTPKTIIRRYAPDSIKFADAKPSSLAEISKDDQVRVLGEKNTEGTEMTAEELVFGTFRNTAATIVAVDATSGSIQAKNWETGKALTIHAAADTQMKKMPGFFGGASGPRGPGPGPGPGGGGGGGGGPRPGGGGGMDLSAMLERMPSLKLADLKPGDQLVISHTKGAKPDDITAITMLAGVEGLLQMIQQQNAARGPSLGGGGGGMGGSGGGLDLGFPSMVP